MRSFTKKNHCKKLVKKLIQAYVDVNVNKMDALKPLFITAMENWLNPTHYEG